MNEPLGIGPRFYGIPFYPSSSRDKASAPLEKALLLTNPVKDPSSNKPSTTTNLKSINPNLGC